MPTHEVFNQVPPIVPFDYSRNPALFEGLHREGAGWAEAGATVMATSRKAIRVSMALHYRPTRACGRGCINPHSPACGRGQGEGFVLFVS